MVVLVELRDGRVDADVMMMINGCDFAGVFSSVGGYRYVGVTHIEQPQTLESKAHSSSV